MGRLIFPSMISCFIRTLYASQHTWLYGVAYIMDYKVIPCYSKICDWPFNSSQDHFGIRQGKQECKVDHGTWGFLKAFFHAYTIHCHDPTNYVVGEAKEVLLLQKSRDHGKEMRFWYFFSSCSYFSSKQSHMYEERRKKKGEKVKNWRKIPNFGHVYSINQHVHFFGAQSLLLINIHCTHGQGPKDFEICFLKNKTIEV